MSAAAEPGVLAARVAALAARAAERILAVYATDFEVGKKSDDSPVTAADLAAHEVLCAGLPEIDPVPVLSEDGALPAQETEWKCTSSLARLNLGEMTGFNRIILYTRLSEPPLQNLALT